jgi:hypothetical protein
VPKFGSQIQTQQIPVKGLTPESSSSAPSSPVAGQLWYDTTNNVAKFYNGSSWVRTDGSDIPNGTITDAKVAAGAAIALSKLAVDPLARANHTGTQTAATISDLAAVVQAYRLDQFAVPTSAVSAGGQRVTNLAAPTTSSDAARLADVQAAQAGIDVKPSVRAASTANVSTTSAPAAVDGVTLAGGDRLLLKNQTTGTENGLWVFASAGAALTRATDTITANTFVFVEEGTTNADTAWMVTNNGTITIGSTTIVWAQFGAATSYQAGNGLTLTGNVIDVVAADGSLTINADSVTVGNVPVSKGGTGGTTAATGRAGLAALTSYSANVGALTAGSASNITHNLGVANKNDIIVSVWEVTSGTEVLLDVVAVDTNTISLKADIAYSANFLRVTVQALA